MEVFSALAIPPCLWKLQNWYSIYDALSFSSMEAPELSGNIGAHRNEGGILAVTWGGSSCSKKKLKFAG